MADESKLYRNIVKINKRRFKKVNNAVIDRVSLQSAGKTIYDGYLALENSTLIKDLGSVKHEKYADENGPFVVNSYKKISVSSIIKKDNKKIIEKDECKITTLEGFVKDKDSNDIYINMQKTNFSKDVIYEGIYKDCDGQFVDFNSKHGLNVYQGEIVVNTILKMFNKRKEYDKEKNNDGESL